MSTSVNPFNPFRVIIVITGDAVKQWLALWLATQGVAVRLLTAALRATVGELLTLTCPVRRDGLNS